MINKHRAAGSDSQAVHRRAEELDALNAVLPFDRCDQLAELLTDDDVATLEHLVSEGMGDNTLRALASDLGYIEAWCQLATGASLPWRRRRRATLNVRRPSPLGSADAQTGSSPGMPAEVEAAPTPLASGRAKTRPVRPAPSAGAEIPAWRVPTNPATGRLSWRQ